ncbi:MAG: nickel pincer cofactor biosynthesis protein LarC, partial [Armatimonadetes bacterium]|nr:nickel pincer cofactor biosynthesis protein LarC [Armatimonadota bacterium]
AHRGIVATRVAVRGADDASNVQGGRDGSRSYAELRHILESADIEDSVRRDALEMLRLLAEAEAAVHGIDPAEVHFHEIGGLDTLVDLAGAAAGLRLLQVSRLVSSPVPWTHGYVETAHGRLPVPAPATARLLEGLPVKGLDIEGETVTPTGAAIVRHFASEFGPMPPMTIEATGIGAGSRELPGVPNILRLIVGQLSDPAAPADDVISQDLMVIEANIDDMPPELFEPALEACFSAGALDAWLTPIQMKHNRPAAKLSALADPADARAVADAILRHTTTLGVRLLPARRFCLPREMTKVATAYGEISVKVARLGGRVVTAQPEYRECVAAAQRSGATVREVYEAAKAAAHDRWARDKG